MTDQTPHPVNRRAHTRIRFSAEASFHILLPTETFSPYHYRGTVTDISLGGLCVRTTQIDRATYTNLLREVRHVKISIRLPITPEPIYLRGKVVWWDFHDGRGLSPAYCNLGVSFHAFTPEAQAEFGALLDNLQAFIEAAETRRSE
jgi:hypothetical protein